MQAVGELDEDDAQILAHREEHLAQVLDAFLLLCLKRNVDEFGHAVYDFRDVAAELAADHRQIVVPGAVLDDVVEEGGADRVGVQLQIGHNLGDGDRMDDIRLARAAHLPAVVFLGHVVGFFHFFEIIAAGLRQPCQQRVDVGRALRLQRRALQFFFHIRHACSFSLFKI